MKSIPTPALPLRWRESFYRKERKDHKEKSKAHKRTFLSLLEGEGEEQRRSVVSVASHKAFSVMCTMKQKML
jgi:hypothetical protein